MKNLLIFGFAILFFSTSAHAEEIATSFGESLGYGWPLKSSTPGPRNLYGHKDEPLDDMAGGYLKISAIVDHRSVLNTHHVFVHAVVISTLLGDEACPAKRPDPLAPPSCPQQRVIVADSDDPDRNRDYDVQVLIKPGKEPGYKAGDVVDIDASVLSDEGFVILKED